MWRASSLIHTDEVPAELNLAGKRSTAEELLGSDLKEPHGANLEVHSGPVGLIGALLKKLEDGIEGNEEGDG